MPTRRWPIICDDFRLVGIAKLGGHIRYFRRHRCGGPRWPARSSKPRCSSSAGAGSGTCPTGAAAAPSIRTFVTRSKDRKDDTLLTTLVDTYAEDGIIFAPATDFAPELLVKYGPLTGRKPTAAQLKDIQFGWQLAKELGRVDVGQTVVVKGLAVLAVEAVEGTDACIRRAGDSVRRADSRWSKWPSRSRTCGSTCPTIGSGHRANPGRGRRPRAGRRGRQDHHRRRSRKWSAFAAGIA